MAPGASDKKAEKSYLTSAVESINPWASSRSTTPTQGNKQPEIPPAPPSNPDDHSTTHLYGQSFKTYPSDCPPLNVQWFHAVDVPKRKPQFNNPRKKAPAQPEKPPARPKKFSAFSVSDSRSIENAYQKLLEATEDARAQSSKSSATTRKRKASESSISDFGEQTITNVPVNEDFLFDVTIEERELAPVYWAGAVYEVRRGTWFYTDGSTLRPCEENLAAQLEEGYLKLKPWLNPARERSASGAKKPVTPKGSSESLKGKASTTTVATSASGAEPKTTSQSQPQSYRLFGHYMNSVATYQDAKTAWMSSEGMLSWVTTSVYERFSGGGYMSGIKLVRGYSEPSKSKEKEKEKEKPKEKDAKGTSTPPIDPLGPDQRQQQIIKQRSKSVSAGSTHEKNRKSEEEAEAEKAELESRQMKLQRQLSSLMGTDGKNKEETEEEIRKREEQEIQDDYNAQAGETQGRDIEHLVLVTHGIGQLLSLRMDSVNFVHDVNIMRKTIKSVYTGSADLKALNSEFGAGPGNCRVQVLPVCWRHLLDFPKKRERKGEHDLGEVEDEEDEYPALEDITIEGVAFARSLISDLALDVLLYQSAYREQISKIVLHECNRIFQLFKERNPEFKGKVHLVGHSLGSAILFDILCRQKEQEKHKEPKGAMRFWSSPEPKEKHHRDTELQFEFDVEDFFCLGSPVGLFQMLKGRTIAARQSLQEIPAASPLNPDHMDDPFLTANLSSSPTHVSPITGLPFSVSSPKAAQLFNIFHPSDPISYRLEPLITPVMKELKPQLLPYTKKGIFGAVAPQGLAGIGAKVGQSVGGLWSSFSAGIASNILNRSLGLTNEEVARMTANASAGDQQAPAAGTNISAGGVIPDVAKMGEKSAERKKQLADSTATEGLASPSGNNPTLIDDELETLYSKFQKSRADTAKDDANRKMQDDERKALKMRAEESKVRALNRNGRVDYSIQESSFDYSPLTTLSSHMSYWADEDVNHFMLSQLLSNRSSRKH